MKILLAIDGSEQSLFAEQFVQQIPFETSPELQIVTVCPSADLHALGPDVPPVVNKMVDECRASSTKLLSQAQQRGSLWAASVQTTLLDGHAAYEILHVIETTHPDLVVVGSHGYGAITRFLHGSVSERVATHAHCPVLVTRNHEKLADFKTIMFADDGSEHAAAAIERFSTFSLKGYTIELIAVLESLDAYGMDEVLLTSPDWQAHRRDIEKRLAQHQILLKPSQAEVKTCVLQAANVSDALTKRAKESAADLIVVGSTGKSGIKKFLLGSVSQRILHHSPCSVWIERHT